MITCPACGSRNRPGARFCWSCAAPLTLAAAPASPARPSHEDTLWLAATLTDGEASTPRQRREDAETLPLNALSSGAAAPEQIAQEEGMEQTEPTAPQLFAGRYELSGPAEVGAIEAIDREPWRRCWACESTANEAGESFCIDCGAALEQRTYRGMITPADEPSGPALISELNDDAARALLPTVWDRAEDDGKLLVLLQESGRSPVKPPLDEVAALRIGVALASLLTTLHAQGLALGRVQPEQLELSASGQLHLRDVPAMRHIGEDRIGAVSGDLAGLAMLLEALTATPRTTRRLEEDEDATEELVEPALAGVLREVRTGRVANAEALTERLADMLAERTRPVALRQRVGAATDVGVVRDHNEDSYYTMAMAMDNTSLRRAWGCYIVADGMGGHAAGEVASGLAIRGAAEVLLSEYLTPTLDLAADYDDAQAREIMHRAALQANEYVLREGRARGNDMGSTLTMALVVGDRLVVANVGDSRTYLLREGRLQRISKDHSLVMRLVELGQLRDEDIYTHPQRNAVLRSLGDKQDVEVDVFGERLRSGDAILLCSDGQWEMTHDTTMEQILATFDDPQQACDELIKAANQAGGEDNITAILVRFV